MERRVPMKRTAMKRSRKPIKARSDKREEELPARSDLVSAVLRSSPGCEARIPTICTSRATEVNEIVRRSQWRAGYLVRSNTETLCHNCHAFITAHPGKDGWAARHGHQIDGSVRDLGEAVHAGAARLARIVRARFVGCSPSCTLDHREAS